MTFTPPESILLFSSCDWLHFCTSVTMAWLEGPAAITTVSTETEKNKKNSKTKIEFHATTE